MGWQRNNIIFKNQFRQQSKICSLRAAMGSNKSENEYSKASMKRNVG